MKKILLSLFVFGLIFTAQTAAAHNPRLVFKQATGTVMMIEKPDVSQAFYGQLRGEADVYNLKIDNDQDFYFSLLVPDVSGTKTDYTARLSGRDVDGREVWQVLAGEKTWSKYYEEFAGDNYLKGPEKTVYLKAGDYTINVGDPGNTGKYVLVVGTKESWPLAEIINTFAVLPTLKKDFFETSPWGAYSNRVGLFALGLIVVLAIILVLLGWFFGRKFWLALLIGLVVILALFSIRFYFGGAEDVWLCQDGEWVAHGKPSTNKPDRPCAEQTLDTKDVKFEPAPAVVYLVRAYLEKNISTLSSEKAVLGGKFYLTNLTFRDNQTAVVSYEDGHNAFVGVFKFTINETEEVEELGFDVVDKN
ncbi:MAG: hypothetical protein WCW56_02465 [Candidatus Paceibacterota bacterium]